ncbi:MAG: hypothetical protein JOZ81_05620 [Chloroflexi bacterium]|nr:hypothetical protein [Chloroflexota bacterium]
MSVGLTAAATGLAAAAGLAAGDAAGLAAGDAAGLAAGEGEAAGLAAGDGDPAGEAAGFAVAGAVVAAGAGALVGAVGAADWHAPSATISNVGTRRSPRGARLLTRRA